MFKKMFVSFLILLIFYLNLFSFQALAQVNTTTSNGKLTVDSINTTKSYFEVSASDLWYMGWHKADSSNDNGPYFAVYKTSEGPASAKWYTMQKDLNNINRWSAKVYFNDFNNEIGEYNITVYQNGITNYQGQTSTRSEHFLGELKVNYLDVTTSETNIANSNFNLYARNTNDFKGMFYAVWRSEDGINTAKWYAMTHDSNEQYVSNIDIQNFDYEVGEYQINVFKTNADDSSTLVSNVKVNVNPVTTSSETSEKSFPVYTYKLNPDLTSAYLAVWKEEDGVGAAKWFGMRFDELHNRWDAEINLSDFNNRDGVYYVNVYGKIKNESDLFLGQTKINVHSKKYQF